MSAGSRIRYCCARPRSACRFTELTLMVSPSRLPVTVTRRPANSPTCLNSPVNSYFLSPSTIVYLEPFPTHALAHSEALFARSVCLGPQRASVMTPEKVCPGRIGSTWGSSAAWADSSPITAVTPAKTTAKTKDDARVVARKKLTRVSHERLCCFTISPAVALALRSLLYRALLGLPEALDLPSAKASLLEIFSRLRARLDEYAHYGVRLQH
jgi:hypothetical protein